MSGPSDHELIRRTLEGNQLSFKKLLERHHGPVFAAVRSVLGDSDDVDDVTQRVYLKIYRGLPRFRGDAKFSTWVYQIARNEAISATRRKRLDTDDIDEVHIAADAAARPDQVYQRDERARQVEEAVGGLDERYRTVLELRYMGERSYEEISELMDLPLGTVKTYIYRAKAALKKHLEDDPDWNEEL